MTSLENLYNHLKTLCSQWFYTKSEVNSSLGDKVDKVTGKGLSANDFTDTYKNKVDGIEAQANKTTVDSSLSSSSENPVQNKVINAALADKVDKVTGKGLSTNDYTTAEKEKLAGVATNANNYTHPTYTSKTKKLYKVSVDSTGHVDDVTEVEKADITGLGIPAQDTTYTPASATPTADTTNGAVGTSAKYAREDHVHPKSTLYAEASHSHGAGDVTDSTAHSNLGTSANADQATINAAVDTKIGNLESIKAIEIVDTKPTASASTMGKLYILSENSKVNVYYTKQSGTGSSATYTWQKMDADILDELSISWNDITGKPSSFTPSSHTHGNITNEGAIGSTAGKVVITGTNGVLDVSDMITEMNTVIEDLIEYGS